ncbi:DUF5348 domain-containing protein [Fredinandcohnia onubensis]|uniref:DUF5348 domain-containing protein n=1 Tax=Fredinandcohnia onubensis TaxID=1571209 RepID=UPI000C0BFDF8|nr:DUF5348 domain-containing protein [Fredinandcohnia onubensis]
MNKKRMRYDYEQEQWYVDIQGRKYALHCGESFELHIGKKTIPCRLELALSWYVIMDDVRFDLREGDQYTISL